MTSQWIFVQLDWLLGSLKGGSQPYNHPSARLAKPLKVWKIFPFPKMFIKDDVQSNFSFYIPFSRWMIFMNFRPSIGWFSGFFLLWLLWTKTLKHHKSSNTIHQFRMLGHWRTFPLSPAICIEIPKARIVHHLCVRIARLPSWSLIWWSPVISGWIAIWNKGHDTVDGWNPPPVDRWFILKRILQWKLRLCSHLKKANKSQIKDK